MLNVCIRISRTHCSLFFLVKFKSAFWRGPAYEEAMKKKMKKVESASQAMSERADEEKQVKLEEIRDATLHSTLTSKSIR